MSRSGWRCEWQFGLREWTWLKADPAPWANEPVGGVAVAQLSDDEFLLVGDHARVTLSAASGEGMVVRVEEGGFKGGNIVGDVGLAPYHDQESKVPGAVKEKMKTIDTSLREYAMHDGRVITTHCR